MKTISFIVTTFLILIKNITLYIQYICIVIMIINLEVNAQNKSIEINDTINSLSIGDRIPPYVFNKIPKKQNTKLFILDFWSTSCSSCLLSFPKMEKLQKEFDDNIQIVLINSWENDFQIKERLIKMNERRKVNEEEAYKIPSNLPVIIGDTLFKQLFPTRGIPHHVWLNDKGTVLYITHGHNATRNHIQKILNGEPVKMSLKNDLALKGIDVWDGFFKPIHHEISPQFYSVFIKYNGGYGGGYGPRIDSVRKISKMIYVNNSVLQLYKEAFGIEKRIMLEVSNLRDYHIPDWLEEGDLIDEWMEMNSFSYEIGVPFGEEKNIMEYMQTDLNRFFGMEKGIEGVIEKREMDCWLIVKIKENVLKSSSLEKKYVIKDDIVKLKNISFSTAIYVLREKLEGTSANRPFLIKDDLPLIDESGIDPEMKVDIELTGDLRNVENVRNQMQKYGLDIVNGKREMELLVIKEIKK